MFRVPRSGRTPMWRRYLRFWGADPPADVDAELSFHVEELIRHYVARGMSADEARAEAVRRFGSLARVRSECLSVMEGSIRTATRREAMDALSQDVRDGFRALTKNPGFTVGAALILALGIGLNTTVFSFNKALLFPSLPIADPLTLVRMWSQNTARGIYVQPLAEADVADIWSSSRAFSDLAAYAVQPVTLTGIADAQRIQALRATSNLFPLLGVSPAVGRTFQPQDAANGGAVAILSERTWRNRFGGDPATVGRDIVLNGRPHTIVGVMPEDFWFDSKEIEVWLPLPVPSVDGARGARTLMTVGRLRPGANMEGAQADMRALAQRLASDHPQTNAGWDILVTGLLPFGPGEKVFFGLVATLTSLLLAAACAHVANLLLARGMERRAEIAIRAALGARRGRIMRQLFVESMALSVVGGACSLLIALPIVAQIRVMLGPRTPYLSDLSLDAATLALTGGLVLVASVLFGLGPALRLSSVTAGDAIKQPPGGTQSGRRRRPLTSALIGLEVAIATVALIVTVLFTRAAHNLIDIPLGFEPENVITFRLDVPDYRYAEPGAASRVLEQVRRRLQALPSIRAAGAGSRLPLNMGTGLPTDVIAIEDRPATSNEQSPWAVTASVTPGYFDALGISLLEGRRFEEQDVAASQPVAIISRSMARVYWPNENPVGRRIRFATSDSNAPWLTVVGVVEDVRPFDPDSPQIRQLYLPFGEASRRALVYFVATQDAPASRMQEVRQAVREIDPELPVLDLQTLQEAMSVQMSGVELGRKSLQVNALIAVALAVSGVYAVVAFAVARRRREIAIRVALGGSRVSLVAMLLREALRPAFIGIVIGLVLSALISRAIAVVLFGVDPLDPLTYSLTSVALCLAAATASCVPALRATRSSTVAALRAE